MRDKMEEADKAKLDKLKRRQGRLIDIDTEDEGEAINEGGGDEE